MKLKKADIIKKPEKYNVDISLELFEQEKYIHWMMIPLKYTIREEVKAVLDNETSNVISNRGVRFTGRRK